MKNPKCYECIYRGNVPGDAHSCCNYPGNLTGMLDFLDETNWLNAKKLKIEANPTGIENEFFHWPVNYDPRWITNCNGFKEKKHAGK